MAQVQKRIRDLTEAMTATETDNIMLDGTGMSTSKRITIKNLCTVLMEKLGINRINTDLTKMDGNLQTLNGMYSAKCIATACMSVADSSAKYSAVKIPLNDFRVLGTLLTSFNGGIKIGKGTSTVLVNGNMFFTTASATQQVWIRITKNGIEQAVALDSTTTNFTSCQITNMMINVKEGDLLEIVKINADLDTIRAGGNSYLTVIAY